MKLFAKQFGSENQPRDENGRWTDGGGGAQDGNPQGAADVAGTARGNDFFSPRVLKSAELKKAERAVRAEKKIQEKISAQRANYEKNGAPPGRDLHKDGAAIARESVISGKDMILTKAGTNEVLGLFGDRASLRAALRDSFRSGIVPKATAAADAKDPIFKAAYDRQVDIFSGGGFP